ncbi:hypothetical protein N431DRAFT_425791 [Stipitochalara longipes BDJ]|nr:hypothetical protein N431DRAFT_425791 [Stipitochalara longipes BDJ]
MAADPICPCPPIPSSQSAHRSTSHAAYSLLAILLIPVAAPAYRLGFLQALVVVVG